MHLWHKWKTIKKMNGTVTMRGISTLWKNVEHPIIAELQKCETCGCERGVMYMINGDAQFIDPEFLRD